MGSNKFNPKLLDVIFMGVRKVNDDKFHHFALSDANGNDVAQLVYCGESEWRIEVDNFPGQKGYYQTNFPIQSVDEFVSEMARIGLSFELNDKASIPVAEVFKSLPKEEADALRPFLP